MNCKQPALTFTGYHEIWSLAWCALLFQILQFLNYMIWIQYLKYLMQFFQILNKRMASITYNFWVSQTENIFFLKVFPINQSPVVSVLQKFTAEAISIWKKKKLSIWKWKTPALWVTFGLLSILLSLLQSLWTLYFTFHLYCNTTLPFLLSLNWGSTCKLVTCQFLFFPKASLTDWIQLHILWIYFITNSARQKLIFYNFVYVCENGILKFIYAHTRPKCFNSKLIL